MKIPAGAGISWPFLERIFCEERTHAARVAIATGGLLTTGFSLRRCRGPVASVRSAGAAQLAGPKATSDGSGIGARFAVSRHKPAIEVVCKLVEYADRDLSKSSPDKRTRPGPKTITRFKDKYYTHDIVSPLASGTDDLLQPFESAEPMQTIQQRLVTELSLLQDSVKATRSPAECPVEFA